MPRILTSTGQTRFVDELNPTDQLASGGPSVLDAAGSDLGEGSPSGSIAPALVQGVDESAQVAPIAFRQTTTPRINAPGVVPRIRPGSRNSGW